MQFVEFACNASFLSHALDILIQRQTSGYGDGNWSGLDVVRSLPRAAFSGLQPELVSGRNHMTKASDLLKFPLLRLDDSKTWSRWFDAAGVTEPVAHGPVLDRASMRAQAAVDYLSGADAPNEFSIEELARVDELCCTSLRCAIRSRSLA